MLHPKIKKLLKYTLITFAALTIILILTIAAYFTFRAKPPEIPTEVSSIADIETYLEDLAAFGAPPGFSIIVIKDGETIYNKAFGYADTPKDINAKPDTIYKWWSMTKVFTATAILQLHEQEKLNIGDPVADHLDFFDIQYTSDTDEKITIRHLLNHSSGIHDNVPEVMGWMHLEDDVQPNNTELLESVFADYAELSFSPGERSEYTNVGYMVLGAIVEKVSDTTDEEYIVENILTPPDMTHTNFQLTPEMLPNAATGSHPLIRWETPLLPLLFDNWQDYIRENTEQKLWFNTFYADSNPPTGLIGSTQDLAKFLNAFLNSDPKILTRETIDLMLTQHIIPVTYTGQTDADFHGLGWEVTKNGDTIEFLAHGDGGPGFGCAMRIYPGKNLATAILANDTTYNPQQILDLLQKLDW